MAATESPDQSVVSDIISNHSFASPADQLMGRRLLNACSKGDLDLLNALILDDPNILTSVTPDRNNCLHIAAMLGHKEFAEVVWSRKPSLFLGTNLHEETPIIAALAAANAALASEMIAAAIQRLQPDMEQGRQPLNEMLLKSDKRGNSILHHAMQNGFEDIAVQLLDIEPRLSELINNINVSPMHMAARRGYSKVLEKLFCIPSSSYSGPGGFTAFHAAVESGHKDIVKQFLKGVPELAYETSEIGYAPLGSAVVNGNLEIVKIFLEYDPNLAYLRTEAAPHNAFMLAALRGFVPIAEEIMKVCPDSAYASIINVGINALHIAIKEGHVDFVNYILRTPQLHRLLNQGNGGGEFPLHIAARMCNPEILRAMLFHERLDCTAVTRRNTNAVDIVNAQTELLKTLKWNESYTLVSNLIPSGWRPTAIDEAKKKIREQAIQEVKLLTQRYITNTSLVAALLSTITFAAAFTLPGGYISDTSDVGLPIFATKAAFQVFLISDTIAMCSSLSVAFLCILATWEDLDLLLNYRKTTRALMWCAYVATVVAFGTGLFTVMAPKNMWLAILVLVLSSILPLLSKIIGEWPFLKLRIRLGRHFHNNFVPSI